MEQRGTKIVLHGDNAPAKKSVMAKDTLKDLVIEFLEHPP